MAEQPLVWLVDGAMIYYSSPARGGMTYHGWAQQGGMDRLGMTG
jgi:hypothetical protein